MALMHVNFFSQVLNLSCSMDVIMPQRNEGIGVEGTTRHDKYPVLWLLHGATDDHTIWQRRTSIERYVTPLGLAVVMPAVELSFYTNMEYGFRYFDYIARELPEICRELFNISDKRKDNYIAGLSMGGYGALKIGLSCPENYATIGCLSAGNFLVGPEPAFEETHERKSPLPNIPRIVFGVESASVFDMDCLLGTKHDLFFLADSAINAGKQMPKIFHACGSEDFLVENARRTRDFFQM